MFYARQRIVEYPWRYSPPFVLDFSDGALYLLLQFLPFLLAGSGRTAEIIIVGTIFFGYNIGNFCIILVEPVLVAFLLETQLLYTYIL